MKYVGHYEEFALFAFEQMSLPQMLELCRAYVVQMPLPHI